MQMFTVAAQVHMEGESTSNLPKIIVNLVYCQTSSCVEKSVLNPLHCHSFFSWLNSDAFNDVANFRNGLTNIKLIAGGLQWKRTKPSIWTVTPQELYLLDRLYEWFYFPTRFDD